MNKAMQVAAFMTGYVESAVRGGAERYKAVARAAEEAAWVYKVDEYMAMTMYFTYKEEIA
jgi:hypothetical protein